MVAPYVYYYTEFFRICQALFANAPAFSRSFLKKSTKEVAKLNLFHNRPLCCCCLLFVALSYAVYVLDGHSHLWLLPILAVLIGVVGTLLTKKKTAMITGTVFVTLGIIAGVLQGTAFYQNKLPMYEACIDETCVIEGRVIRRLSSQSYASTFVFELESVNGTPADADIKLETSYASALQPGERARLTVTGRAFETLDGYDERSQALADGMLVAFVCETPHDCELLEDNSSVSWRVWFAEKNEALAFRLREHVGGREGCFLIALLLGDRTMLDPDISLAFERTGVSHLLALSGSHFSILMGVFDWILRKLLHCHKAPRLILLIALSTGYLFLTGCSPSAMRAVLMFCGLSIGFYLRTEHDPITALSVSLAILVAISPSAVYDLGMWMSYVATAAIVLTLPIVEDWKITLYDHWKLPLWMYLVTIAVMTALFVGIVANVTMTVILALAFLKIPLLSVIHTLLLTLPISIALVLAMLGILSPIFSYPCRLVAGWIIAVTESASDLSYILLPVAHPASKAMAMLLGLSLIFVTVAKLRSRKWALLPLSLSVVLAATAFFGSYLPEQGAQLNYIRESDGEVLVLTSGGHAAAFCFTDGTSTAAHDIARTVTDANCAELDDLILSHYHNKDTYFLSELATEIKVRRLRLPIPLNDTEKAIAAQLEETATVRGIEVLYDLSDIRVSNLEDCRLERSEMPGSRHIAILFSMRVAGNDVVYLNASVPDSALLQAADRLLRESETVIVGKTGLSKSSLTPIPYLRHELEHLLIAHEELERLVHYEIKPQNIHTAPEVLSLDLK